MNDDFEFPLTVRMLIYALGIVIGLALPPVLWGVW